MVDLIAESSFNASKVESQLRNKWDHKRKRCERGTQGLEAHGKEMDFFSFFSVYYVGKILTLFFFPSKEVRGDSSTGSTRYKTSWRLKIYEV